MALAVLCSGQGRQHARMYDLTGEVPECTPIFRHAAAVLGGRDPRELVRTGNDESFHHNRLGQILCTTQALAAYHAIANALPDRLIVAGYSVGELAAWSVAGVLAANDTIDLAALRAEAMDKSTLPGDGLLFVRGLHRDIIEELCFRVGAGLAIVNPGNAFILGGGSAALERLADEARIRKAERVVSLSVEVASHTKQLAPASFEFRQALSRVPVSQVPLNNRRLLSGIDGTTVFDIENGLDKLAAQISHTVQWQDCLESCIECGATAFLELGPGRALSNMVAATYTSMPTRSLEDFKSIQGVRDWLTGDWTHRV